MDNEPVPPAVPLLPPMSNTTPVFDQTEPAPVTVTVPVVPIAPAITAFTEVIVPPDSTSTAPELPDRAETPSVRSVLTAPPFCTVRVPLWPLKKPAYNAPPVWSWLPGPVTTAAV